MTTLAIIGGGIAGRSLLFALAKTAQHFDKILFFYSDSFASPCSTNSTAIVAGRGISRGISPLGDKLMAGFAEFTQQVASNHPKGVTPLIHYHGADDKLEQFRKRYPDAKEAKLAGELSLTHELSIAAEPAFMIDPTTYLDWLLEIARQQLVIEVIEEFVVEIDPREMVHLKTQSGLEFCVDELVLTCGAAGVYWKNFFDSSKLQSSKSVQGSYLEFLEVDLGLESFSVTLKGDNLIYDSVRRRLLMGSTTQEVCHQLAPPSELHAIYQRLQSLLQVKLPAFELGKIKVGLREKASKREPYLIQQGAITAIGGLYKNGYSLGPLMAQEFIKKYSSSSSHPHP